MSPYIVDTVDDLIKGNSAPIMVNDASRVDNMPGCNIFASSDEVLYVRLIKANKTPACHEGLIN